MTAQMIRSIRSIWGFGGSPNCFLFILCFQYFAYMISFGCVCASKLVMVCNNLYLCYLCPSGIFGIKNCCSYRPYPPSVYLKFNNSILSSKLSDRTALGYNFKLPIISRPEFSCCAIYSMIHCLFFNDRHE